jgi:hypothetical protein
MVKNNSGGKLIFGYTSPVVFFDGHFCDTVDRHAAHQIYPEGIKRSEKLTKRQVPVERVFTNSKIKRNIYV